MNQSNFSRFMLAADLFICSIWLMLVLHDSSLSHYPLLWAIPVFRIWLSFLTYRRSRMALMPLSFLAVFYMGTLQMHANPAFLLFNRPGLILIKSVSSLFFPGVLTPDGFSDMWHGSLDYRYTIMAIASIWVVIIPAVMYVCRVVRKQLVPSQFGVWKRTGLVAYILFVLMVMSVFVDAFGASSISVFVLTVLLLLIPMIFNRGKVSGLLTRAEQAYVIALIILGITYTCGLSYNQLSSVTTMVTPVAVYALVNWCMNRKTEHADALLLVAGSLFFYMGQYATDMLRVVLLLLSLGLYAVDIIRFAYGTRMYWKSIALYLSVAVVLPVLCIGYNPYTVMEARRCIHYDDYDSSRNGLMLVEGKDGYGIRDRYGIILPPKYDRVDHLESSKPYCKVLSDDLWMIYDIERHKFLSEEKFTEVISYDKYTYGLVSEDGRVRYLDMPTIYSRYSCGKEAKILDQFPPKGICKRQP